MTRLHARTNGQGVLPFSRETKPKLAIAGLTPYFETELGDAYLADSLQVLRAIPDGAINAVVTSPPYALHFKKEYGNRDKHAYVDWFLPFATEVFRVLAKDGSFVLNIGGSYNKGLPTRSLYHFELLIALVRQIGFHLAQECFWFNPAKMPMPAEWVTVRRIRVKDAVEYVWWLSKTPWPKANNRAVLRPYSPDMARLNQRGVRRTTRPSGHNIKPSFGKVDSGGSIPPNMLEPEPAAKRGQEPFSAPADKVLASTPKKVPDPFLQPEPPTDLLKFGNNAANDLYTERCKAAGQKIHPARFPAALPEFFIKLLTDEGDIVLDPFAGSNTTGAVAERLERRWMAVERVEDYLRASRFRFE